MDSKVTFLSFQVEHLRTCDIRAARGVAGARMDKLRQSDDSVSGTETSNDFLFIGS